MRCNIAITLLGQNDLVREGLRQILTDHQFDVVQSIRSIDTASSFDSDAVHIMILDQAESGDIEALRGRFPESRIVVLSEAFDYDELLAAFAAGADAVLIKEISSKPLVVSLRLVATGEKVLPTQLVAALPLVAPATRMSEMPSIKEAGLSDRERSILCCLVMGWQNKVISRHFDISEATVKTHVKAILRKLRVKNRTQAAMQAIAISGANGTSALVDTGAGLVEFTMTNTKAAGG